jgi:hypothetical protein
VSYEFSDGVASALAERGWMVDGRLKRVDIARAIGDWLESEGHIATSVDDEKVVASTIDEIALGLIGTTDGLFHEIIAGLSGPRGLVQDSLADGLVLASTRVTRKVVVEGIPPRERSFSARLLSSNAEVLRATIVEQQKNRVASSIAGTANLLETVGKRVPELAGERARVLTEVAAGASQLALPGTTE